MFTVGAEINLSFLRTNARGALAVSIAGTGLPLAIGAIVATPLISEPKLFPSGNDAYLRILFFSAAIAVTAFPVMARIIDESGLKTTGVATIALSAGFTSDLVAWGLLALVLGGLNRNFYGALLTLVGAVSFSIFVVVAVRPALGRLLAGRSNSGVRSNSNLFVMLVVVMMAAFVTELIGIHPAFGAFLVGAVAPRGHVTSEISLKITPVVVHLLLPLFFVYAGLNARIGLINSPKLVFITLIIIGAACFSKVGSCWLTARLAGYPNRDATAIGALMNARGLVELILLTVGLERRVIAPALYSIMVLMALVTTFVASPALSAIYGTKALQPETLIPVETRE